MPSAARPGVGAARSPALFSCGLEPGGSGGSRLLPCGWGERLVLAEHDVLWDGEEFAFDAGDEVEHWGRTGFDLPAFERGAVVVGGHDLALSGPAPLQPQLRQRQSAQGLGALMRGIRRVGRGVR